MDLNKLSLGDKIVAGAGILLLLFMLLFDWHSVGSFGIGPLEGDGDAVAWPAFLALLLTIALVAAVLVRKLTTTDLPELPVPWNQAIFFGSIGVPVLLLLKLLLKFDYIAGTAYLMIIAAGAMAYGGFLISQDKDGGGGGGSSAPPTPF